MTSWLQDQPNALMKRLRTVASSGDLREISVNDEARALMHAAADMIGREVMLLPPNEMNYSRRDTPISPLFWSWRDRISSAMSVLRGNVRVLRRLDDQESAPRS